MAHNPRELVHGVRIYEKSVLGFDGDGLGFDAKSQNKRSGMAGWLVRRDPIVG